MSNKGRVQDKVVIITGANRGMGLSAAKIFNREGAKLLLVDASFDASTVEWATALGEQAVVLHKADVSREDDVESYSQAALDRFGGLDGVVLNAGIAHPKQSWLEMDADLLDKIYSVNQKGVWLGIKHGVEVMRRSPHGGKGGALVLISSVASTYGEPGLSAYAASKWAVRGMSLVAAQEFAPFGIRCNCIQPGTTATEMYTEAFTPEIQAAIEATNTLKRAADPSEIANVMLFLISDESSFMNGSTLAVHAGQTPT